MELLAQWVAAVAAVAALATSAYIARRQMAIEAESYLILGLQLQPLHGEQILVSTSLENRSPHPKKLDVVFLLLGHCEETPTETFNAILRDHEHPEVSDISEFGPVTRDIDPKCSAGDRQYLRLDYYTRENSEVADEVLTYDAVLSTARLRPGTAYSLRLFLYGRGRLHRVVQRALVAQMPGGSSANPDVTTGAHREEPNYVIECRLTEKLS